MHSGPGPRSNASPGKRRKKESHPRTHNPSQLSPTKELTDQELLNIARRKRQQIERYRRDRGDRRPSSDTPAGIAKHPRAKKKNYGKDKRALPAKEFLMLPNEFIEAVYKRSFSQNETKVLWFVVRKTWGWQKLSDFIPLKQFANALDLIPPNIVRALSSLTQRQIVIKLDNKRYAIQSDTGLWRDKPRKSSRKKSRTYRKSK